MTVGEKIKTRCDELGIAQFELANRIGMTEVALSRCIRGDRTFKGPYLANIARVLDMPIEELIEGHEAELAKNTMELTGESVDRKQAIAAVKEPVIPMYAWAGQSVKEIEAIRTLVNSVVKQAQRIIAERIENLDNIAAKDWEIVDEAKEQQASHLEAIVLEQNEETDIKKKPPIDNNGTSAELVINDEFPQTEEEPIKLTLSVEPCDILAVTHADDGRALVSLAIGNNIEVQLTVEEKAEDFMDRLIDREGREDCSTCKYGNDTNGTRCRDCLEFDKWTGRKK